MFASILAFSLFLSPQGVPPRPRDLWVFRSVLDDRARIVTLALHKDLYVAYDATNCGIYRAWTGGVKFDGAVYTSVHGPQPTTFGNLHINGIVDQPVWSLWSKGAQVPAKVEFKGYRFEGFQAALRYEVKVGKRVVTVSETPECLPGQPLSFERRFEVAGLNKGESLSLLTATPREFSLKGANPTFQLPPGSTNRGMATFILRNGRTVYQTTITPRSEGELKLSPTPKPQEPVARQPGAAMRVYWIGTNMDKIPRLIGGQTPNYSVVVPKIDLEGPKAFGNVAEDQFYVRFTGLLNVKEPGDYEFRLTSDDGSKFTIRDEVIVDHDVLHSSEEGKVGKFRLSQGEHPFELDFFEQSGGEMVRLEWKRPGATQFEVIPATTFTTPEGEVRVTAPGKKTIFDAARRWRPGDGLPLAGVHPSFDLETVRPKDFKPLVGGIDFLPDGRMVLCAWEPDGGVYVLDGVQAPKPHDIKVKRIAAGLAEPLGIAVVRGDIYVLQKQELTRLRDLNGDGQIDEYYCVANGWGVTSNFHEFAFGLVYDKGYFYANLATAIDPGGRSTQPQNPDRGKTIKIGLDGTFTYVASGLRTPNGIGRGFNNEIYITDNQGDWLPSSKVVHLTEGAFYGNRSVDPVGKKDTLEVPPVVWLPQNEIGNSPSQPARLNIGPYKNQMIHGDVTHGGVKRVFVERVNGALQGCVFRWTQGLEAGINRIAWGPDKALYVGGIGSTGNWGQEGKERFGLQRLSYNGKLAFEPLAIRAKANGFEVELTKPLALDLGEEPGDYSVLQWRYEPTAVYGGPKIGEQKIQVKSVTLGRDRMKVFLEMDGHRSGHVVHIKMNRGLMSADGEDLWTTEGWYTLNAIPAAKGRVNPKRTDLVLPGFKALSASDFRGFRKTELPGAWQSDAEGVIGLDPKRQGRGDIVTKEQFADFDLRLDWKIEAGGNSGIMYRADELHEASYLTGPEMQVLDDDLHPDGRNLLTSSGSNYAMYARSRDMVRPPMEWNRVRIRAQAGHIQYWLNGYKVADFDMNSADWKERKAKGRFASLPDYGSLKKGHIVLQDHGNRVWFRNVQIRSL